MATRHGEFGKDGEGGCGIGTQNTPSNGRIFLLFQTSQAFQ
jgi:hypothetical protein